MSDDDPTIGDPAPGSQPHFERLLILIVAGFLISGFDGRWATIVGSAITGVLMLVAFRATSLRQVAPRLAMLAIAAFAAVIVSSIVSDGSSLRAFPAFAQAFLLTVLLVVLLGVVVKREVIDMQTLLGAIAGYALIGLAFGWLYLGLDVLDEDQFSMAASDTPAFPEFSFVVLTTLGFGNQLPTASLSARMVVLEAVIGQIFLATFVARLVSLYGRRRWVGDDPGSVPADDA